MKRDFNEQICDLDGTPVRSGATVESLMQAFSNIAPMLPDEMFKQLQEEINKAAGKPLTFGSACVASLMGAYEDEKGLSDDARLTRMELARRIHKGGVQEITPKDRDIIKPLVKKRFAGILVPVLVSELLEKEAVESRPALESVG